MAVKAKFPRSGAPGRARLRGLPGVLWALVLAGSIPAVGARADGTAFPPGLFDPAVAEDWTTRFAAGIFLAIEPADETGAIPPALPGLNLNLRTALPAGFRLMAALEGNLVNNAVSAGLGWSYDFDDHWSVMVSDRVPLAFGYANGFGLSTNTWILGNQPGVRFGYAWNHVRISLDLSVTLDLQREAYVGNETVTDAHPPTLGGAQGVLMIENLSREGGHLYYGMALQYQQAGSKVFWVFSDVDNAVLYPRFEVGYVF